MDLREAAAAFTAGFSFTRLFTYPFEVVKVGPLLVMRDAPPRKNGRNQEVVAVDLPCRKIIHTMREYRPARWILCAINPVESDHASIREEIKQHHFRAMHSEPFMVANPADSTLFSSSFPVQRVLDPIVAARINTAARSRQILPQHLVGDAPIRLFAAFDRERPIGWVKSIDAGPETTWVSNLFVDPAYRRQRLGAALMTQMLAHDHTLGVQKSVLLASTMGAKLYETLAYHHIGLLQVFSPLKGYWMPEP